MSSTKVTLVSPDQREYVSTSPVEVTRLKSQGYTVKGEKSPDAKS